MAYIYFLSGTGNQYIGQANGDIDKINTSNRIYQHYRNALENIQDSCNPVFLGDEKPVLTYYGQSPFLTPEPSQKVIDKLKQRWTLINYSNKTDNDARARKVTYDFNLDLAEIAYIGKFVPNLNIQAGGQGNYKYEKQTLIDDLSQLSGVKPAVLKAAKADKSNHEHSWFKYFKKGSNAEFLDPDLYYLHYLMSLEAYQLLQKELYTAYEKAAVDSTVTSTVMFIQDELHNKGLNSQSSGWTKVETIEQDLKKAITTHLKELKKIWESSFKALHLKCQVTTIFNISDTRLKELRKSIDKQLKSNSPQILTNLGTHMLLNLNNSEKIKLPKWVQDLQKPTNKNQGDITLKECTIYFFKKHYEELHGCSHKSHKMMDFYTSIPRILKDWDIFFDEQVSYFRYAQKGPLDVVFEVTSRKANFFRERENDSPKILFTAPVIEVEGILSRDKSNINNLTIW